MPSLRKERRVSALNRLLSLPPSWSSSSGRWAKRTRSGRPPSAAQMSIWMPVLVTWSSPRITWVMPAAMSSTTDVKV